MSVSKSERMQYIYVCVCIYIYIYIYIYDKFENAKLEFVIGKTEVLRQITRHIRSEGCKPYCDPTATDVQISGKQFQRLCPVVCSFPVQLFLVNSFFFMLPNFFLLDGQTPRTLFLLRLTRVLIAHFYSLIYLSFPKLQSDLRVFLSETSSARKCLSFFSFCATKMKINFGNFQCIICTVQSS